MQPKAKVVVGLGFGDEGKGITTDYLASQSPNAVVVRYCGGHQAGHNVVIGGTSHISASYGAGVLRGLPTYLSEYCCFYPPNMERERDVLKGKTSPTHLVIHPLAKLTTPYDVAFNRVRERRLNHGSCGMGIAATMQRNEGPYKLYAVDTLNPMVLEEKLCAIGEYYERLSYEYRINSKELNKLYKDTVEVEMGFFRDALNANMFNISGYQYLTIFDNIIFEGAQGILLDKDHGIFPNVTYANTTSKNAIAICNLLNITDIELFYVTRCYLTRHGNGWMPNNFGVKLINNENETNILNDWQGNFRTGELDYNLLSYALVVDSAYSTSRVRNLVVTCLDQRPDFKFDNSKFKSYITTFYGSYSPDSKDFKRLSNL